MRQARLTAAGLAERTELDRRSDAFARSVLEPLTERQRVELAAAMGEVERLLAASIIRIDVADPAGPDARWCFERYFAELAERFDAGFDPARSIPAQAHELSPPAGVLLVASLRQEPVGCGAVKFHGSDRARSSGCGSIAAARGLGPGHAASCRNSSATRGTREQPPCASTRTGRSPRPSRSTGKTGYREVDAFNDEPYAHHWFEKRL